MIREMHVWLDLPSMTRMTIDVCTTYTGTCKALREQQPVIHTTLITFAQLWFASQLFVHYKGQCHEITLGLCDGSSRYIRKEHNIAKLLAAGDFGWFEGCELCEKY